MKKIIIFVSAIFIYSCNKNIDGPFKFPSNEFNPSADSAGLKLINSVLVGYPTIIGYGGDGPIVFDGVNLVVTGLTQYDKINFNILNTNLDVVTSYDATATNIYRIYTATSNGAGNIYAIWQDNAGTRYFSAWPTTNPTTPISSIVFNPATYGCDSGRNDFKISVDQNIFYGICSSSTLSKSRLFSFNLSGALLSSIELDSSYGGGSMSIIGQAIYLTVGDTYGVKSFVKFNTSFQNIGTTAALTNNLPSNYIVASFATNGSNLFIINGYLFSSPCSTPRYQACARIVKTSLDGL